jgi:protein TonB
MQNKTSFKQELERKQKSFLLVGMLVALGMSLMAFEWASFDLEHTQVDAIETEDLDLEPVLEMVKIEKPKPKYTARVKEKEFDFDKDLKLKVKIDIDSVLVKNDNVIVDTSIASNDPIIDLGDGDGDGPIIEPITTIAQVMPEFPGGIEAMYKYLGKNIKYPEMDKRIGIKGKVYLSFVVEKNGEITDVNVMRGISEGCDKVALSAVKKMPKWTPGENLGKKVRVKYTLPVKFELH